MQFEQKHYKIVLIGASRSGKTLFLNSLLQIPKPKTYLPTNTIQTKSKYLEIEGKSVNIEILDTPGSSQYETLRQSTYKGSQALLFIFDITDDYSFDFISQEIQLISEKDLCSYDCSGVLIGINPGKKQRKVSFEEASAIGNAIGSYFEVTIDQKQKILDILKNIARERVKFDKEDIEVKSMTEKIYQNCENPSLSSLKKKFQSLNESKKKLQESKEVNSQPAAPQEISEAQQKPKIILIKCLLIGEAKVGKSAMFLNFGENGNFPESYNSTIGVEFRVVDRLFDGLTYKIQIWDTAGLQKFQAITKIYYKGTKVGFIVYDTNNYETFAKAKSLISEFKKENQESGRYLCLVGNKTDLPRSVSTEEGMALAQIQQTDFMEICAKNKNQLDSLFFRAIKFIHNKINNQ